METIGTVKVVAGPMYSGKTRVGSTDFLVATIHGHMLGIAIRVLYPGHQHRDGTFIKDRTFADVAGLQGYQGIPAIPVDSQHPEMILEHVRKAMEHPISERRNGIIALLDESQWIRRDSEIVPIIDTVRGMGVEVIVVGLDLDFLRRPFGAMGDLMTIADEVIKTTARCADCGQRAIYSQRYLNGQIAPWNDPIVVVTNGKSQATDPSDQHPPDIRTYKAKCVRCHQLPPRPS